METQTTTLEALLREWAELEPERCENPDEDAGRFTPLVLVADEWCYISSVFFAWLYPLQGAVQEAIEARGWQYEHHAAPCDDGSPGYAHRASVDYGRGACAMLNVDTPSEAILSALVQALRAQV